MATNGRHSYLRQPPMKMNAVMEDWDTDLLRQYGRMCAHALARAHSGGAAMISGDMGSGWSFDDAIVEFVVECSDQNRSDHRLLLRAVRQGRIPVATEI